MVSEAAGAETLSKTPTSWRPLSVTIFREARKRTIRLEVAILPFLLRQWRCLDWRRDVARWVSRHQSEQ
jgi:hypothetical protein